MKKKIDNPVSRSMIESIWNQFGEYLPVIYPPTRSGQGYAIGANLPKEHKKWIAHINGNPGFREMIKHDIENIFSRYVFDGGSYLRISFSPMGTAFETDGINGCMIYVEPESPSGCTYAYHNIDSFEQAMVLFLALSAYLPKLYSALENFESGEYDPKDFPPLQERLDANIKLNRVPECQMKYGECLHWKSVLCEICTRNPKSHSLPTQKDVARLGDKWEPEGGLPGKRLCDICGANLSTDKCPFCK